MRRQLTLFLLLTSTLATAAVLYVPLYADGPCFEVVMMNTSTAMKKAHPDAGRNCNCRCNRDRVCPCGAAITDIYRGTVPTARYCSNSRYRCADDFTIPLDSNGRPRQVAIGQIRACNDYCEVTLHAGGRHRSYHCTVDLSAPEQTVYASYYELTGDPCPQG